MKKKFKIMYPTDYWDNDKQGKPYHPGITKLSEVLGKYDVVWK